MKQALLDTNFILTCVKQKIDFFEDLKFKGLKILIPTQVINEIKKISQEQKKKQKLHSKDIANLSLKILKKKKNQFEEIDIKTGHVDKKIKKYVENNSEILVATLDKELKRKIKNHKIVIRGRKKLEII